MKENKTILITGVAGLLGSRLADWMVENTNHNIVGVDDLSGGYIDNVHNQVQFHQFDLAESDRLEKFFGAKIDMKDDVDDADIPAGQSKD